MSGECHYQLLERQSSFSEEVTSLKRDGTKAFFLESRTTTTEKIVGNASGVFTGAKCSQKKCWRQI